VAGCWSKRGCTDEMQAACPHAIDPTEKCPAECYYGKCGNDTNKATGDPALIFNPDIDRSAAAKQQCVYCEFFLTRGPRLVERELP
jgi:hypothetical protein